MIMHFSSDTNIGLLKYKQWQRRRAIEALVARAPSPDSIATVANSLQNGVNSVTLCIG